MSLIVHIHAHSFYIQTNTYLTHTYYIHTMVSPNSNAQPYFCFRRPNQKRIQTNTLNRLINIIDRKSRFDRQSRRIDWASFMYISYVYIINAIVVKKGCLVLSAYTLKFVEFTRVIVGELRCVKDFIKLTFVLFFVRKLTVWALDLECNFCFLFLSVRYIQLMVTENLNCQLIYVMQIYAPIYDCVNLISHYRNNVEEIQRVTVPSPPRLLILK